MTDSRSIACRIVRRKPDSTPADVEFFWSWALAVGPKLTNENSGMRIMTLRKARTTIQKSFLRKSRHDAQTHPACNRGAGSMSMLPALRRFALASALSDARAYILGSSDVAQ
jgi:hypothetical protein